MSLASTIETLNSAVGSLPAGDAIKPGEKAALIAACDKLKASVEGPMDVVFRMMMGTHNHVMARIAVEMGVFDTMVGKPDGMTVDGLACTLKADTGLVVRVLRTLARLGFFEEIGHNKFTATPLASGLVSVSPLSDAIVHFGLAAESLVKAPYFLAERGYKNPSDVHDGPFQYALNTKLHYFDWLKDQPAQQKAFNTLMQISRANHGDPWFNFYPVEERLKVKDSTDTLLIDIGGGLGHDITAFQAKYPNLPGRLILQDLPEALSGIKQLESGIKTMEYDFFTPQPIKGARAYYLRNILHDWPDKQSLQILANVYEAMDKDSLLLINDNALPEENVSLFASQLDITMMAYFGSLDRTEKQFIGLLESAGFHVLNVWAPKPVPGAPASGILFEAVKNGYLSIKKK